MGHRLLTRGLVLAVALLFVQPVAAHSGSIHASTPHWAFLLLILGGGVVMGGSAFLGQRVWSDHPTRTLSGVLIGLGVALLGTIAIIQIQIEPVGTTPSLHAWYPPLAVVITGLLTTGSLLLGVWQWPTRPEYSALGFALGIWVGYPALMPNSGYRNPLGYLLVVVVPLLAGYILWRDVWPLIRSDVIDGISGRVGGLVAAMFGVFFLFSAGLFTVNPEQGVNGPTSAFVTTASFANPLVVWPAVEFYLPSLPLAGAMSVGTALLIGTLVGLIGLNASMMTSVWQRSLELPSSGGVLGGLATTGATACCCCGPAVYAVASVFFGVSASPLYWAFIDPASPLGALFFAAAVILLVWSAKRFAAQLADTDACSVQPTHGDE
ncbi:hypothetical protein C475_19343 [Halosimplex carlsbadense 2-9-1]|uniref:Uncharacterized protein n=2 Tax=Halosimplex carlsbadense TaxID=171164 RepID=M0CES5_9EURY|nr:hypothetical protein C475_19343 [Halosimplex carlsbadense 2-9-1]